MLSLPISDIYEEHSFSLSLKMSSEVSIFIPSSIHVEYLKVLPFRKVIKPGFVVIIPMYNTAQYILRTLRSVLNQTVQPEKIFVIDDKSLDSSADVVSDFITQHPQIQLVRNKINLGPFLSKTRALIRLKSNFTHVAFVDSDDLVLHNMYETLFEEFSRNSKCRLVFPHMYRVKSKSIYQFKGEPTRRCFAGALLKADIFVQFGYFEPLRYAADGGFFYRLEHTLSRDEFCDVVEPLYRAEIRDESLTQKTSSVNLDDTQSNLQYLNHDRKQYVDFFTSNPTQRVSYLDTFGLAAKMLAVNILYIEEGGDYSQHKGLVLNRELYESSGFLIDTLIDVLNKYGCGVYLDCLLKPTLKEQTWLCVWV